MTTLQSPIDTRKRIEIKLTEEVSNGITAKAREMNMSRKAYIEYLCIKHSKTTKR